MCVKSRKVQKQLLRKWWRVTALLNSQVWIRSFLILYIVGVNSNLKFLKSMFKKVREKFETWFIEKWNRDSFAQFTNTEIQTFRTFRTIQSWDKISSIYGFISHMCLIKIKFNSTTNNPTTQIWNLSRIVSECIHDSEWKSIRTQNHAGQHGLKPSP